jgi:hypothetical protein
LRRKADNATAMNGMISGPDLALLTSCLLSIPFPHNVLPKLPHVWGLTSSTAHIVQREQF